MFADLLLILTALYVAEFLLVAFGTVRSSYPTNPLLQPMVSIIIAARNEEVAIGKCLDSIARLDYPTNCLEVIVVNDRSTDDTARIIQKYASTYPNIRPLHAVPSPAHLQGKTNALAQGILASQGEILMITDADCVVPRSWVKKTVQYYVDEKVGIVPGVTLLHHTDAFSGMQSLDWVLLFAAAAGTIRLGFPVTAMGNNFSIRRSTYDSVGGYESLPFSVTEDYALFHAVAGKGEYSIRLPVDPETMVLSDPCDTWDQLFRQKQRWFLGGRDMKGKYIAGYAIPFLFHLVLMVSLIVHPALGLITLAVKTCADVLLSLPMLMRLRQWGLLRYFPLVEAYLVCYTVILPLAVMFGGQTVWKGQILRNKPAAKSKAP